jgi:hypothetical protein
MQRQEEPFQESQLALETEKRAVAERARFEHLRTTVQRYIEYLAEVARGDLGARLTLDGTGNGNRDGPDDLLIAPGHSLNETVASFQNMVTQIEKQRGDLRTTIARYVEQMAEITQDNRMVAPIIVDGQFCGIAGVDLDLERLQGLANQVNVYNGSGELVLRSENGTLVAVAEQSERGGGA